MTKALGDGLPIIEVADDPRDRALETLKAENRRLQRSLTDADLRADRAREDADRALANLRRQLSPLYRALQMVFGELDAAGVTEPAAASIGAATPPPAGTDPRIAAIWDSWKARLGPGCARIIEALLLHPELNTTQLAIAGGMNRNTVPNLIYKLNQAGLINKTSGRFSLKALP